MTGRPAEVVVEPSSGRTVTARITGEIDMSTAKDLLATIDAAVSAAAAASGVGPDLVVDLAEVTFLDSQGLWLLSDLARRHGADRVAVVAPPGTVAAEVLGISSMADVLTVRASMPPTAPPG
jgi:anti-anti-sigma factor